MTELRLLAAAGGAALIVLMISDAVGTLIVTQGESGPWRPTRVWYSASWRMTRSVAVRLPSRAGEVALTVYPAVSLLGLLLIWLVGLVLGWTLIYVSLGFSPEGGGDVGNVLYYAGASLLTPAFGTAHDNLVRLLTLAETLTGLGTIALLISYLPALYGAYSRREARLLTLDDPLGERLVPARVIAVHAPDANLDSLYRFFAEWELWTAEVLESHVSYPMVALFRSQHPGQSWITALGVVTDAAALTCACVAGAEGREPYFMYRRGRRAVEEIAARLHVPESTPVESWLTRERLGVARQTLAEVGLPLRDGEQAWELLNGLRAPYGSRLQQLIDFLLAPHGFWGHSAEATVAEGVRQATIEARARARRARRGR